MIAELREKIVGGQFEFSKHAVDQMLARRISVAELRAVFVGAEIIETYPQDKYGPSCLLFGTTDDGRAFHVQCSHPGRPLVKIITTYEPEPGLWIDFRIRRHQS